MDYKFKKDVKQLSFDIVKCAIKVHNALGPGLLESVYEKCLKYELERSGFHVQQQLSVKIEYYDIKIESDLRIDLLVNDCVVVELKSVSDLLPVHEAQLLTYMKILEKPQGLLINFNVDRIVDYMVPLVNKYYEKLL